MLGQTYDNQLCSIARTLEVVGERWSLLIIRDALPGLRRFEEYQDSLGIARNVGAPEEPVSLNLFSLLAGRKTLAGSGAGGIRETQEMLDFCAEHGIGAQIELITAAEINEAFERVQGSDVPYRFVIDTTTI